MSSTVGGGAVTVSAAKASGVAPYAFDVNVLGMNDSTLDFDVAAFFFFDFPILQLELLSDPSY